MSKTPIFNQVQHTKPGYNIFDLTHDKKLSGKMGKLIPVMVMDCIPGDKIKIQSSAMVRLAPTIAPVMHRINVFIHHFFVPNRLLWENWEDFITGGKDGLNNSVHPYLTAQLSALTVGSLSDYLGLPVGADVPSTGTRDVNAFPFAAYQAIFEEYYNDNNVGNTIDYQLVDGQNNLNTALTDLRDRSWQHDYLTSALPWTQRGPEAMLPLGTAADVVLKTPQQTGQNPAIIRTAATHAQSVGNVGAGGLPNVGELQSDYGSSNLPSVLDPNGTLEVDLSTATASTIIELRRAIKLQEWLEKNAVGGARYTEVIKVHFGVNSSDGRLQRPEYIGGSKTPIKISEVLQTTPDVSQPLGTMGGHAVSVGGGESFSYFCEEHGYMMSIMSIIPESAYQQGIPRHFMRNDKFDYYWPEFAHIGEQAILPDEVVVQSTIPSTTPWGYTPRYAEYKYIQNSVHGDYRTNLDFWHLGRKFASLPNLNYDFMKMQASEVDRIFAVQSGDDNLWCQVINNITARRPMPIFGTPKL